MSKAPQNGKFGFQLIGGEMTAWRWDEPNDEWVQIPLDEAPEPPIIVGEGDGTLDDFSEGGEAVDPPYTGAFICQAPRAREELGARELL